MATIQFKRGVQANVPATGNPGEPFFAEDTGKLYVAGADGQVRPLSFDAANLDGMGFDAILYVSAQVGNAAGSGSYTNPFNTISAAISATGSPQDAADFKKHYLIYVIDDAAYAESLTIPHRRVSITGAGFTLTGTITMEIDAAKAFSTPEAEAHAMLNFLSSVAGADARDEHQGKVQGFTITGDIKAVLATGGTQGQHDITTTGVIVDGEISSSGAGEGHFSTSKSRLKGSATTLKSIVGATLDVERAEQTDIDQTVDVRDMSALFELTFGGDVAIGGSFTGTKGLRSVEFTTGSNVSIPNATSVKMDAETIGTYVEATVSAPSLTVTLASPGLGVGYDNATSGLSANDVQAAIDELYAEMQTIDGGTFPGGGSNG